MQVHHAQDELGEGDRMDFTMWMGPLPVRWIARIQEVSASGFSDVQVRGPFKAWEHRHEFVRVDDAATDVVDTIRYSLRAHPLWGPIGLGMGLSLPILFAFRAWKTRRLLELRIAG
jgi:ligand-binding SRPBCC domain-containing protein